MVPMQCVGCGANLEIELDMNVFACAYCGAKQQVIARGGTVSLKPVTEALRQVQRGTDRTAAELAMPRLERELAENAVAHKQALAQPISIGTNGVTKAGAWTIALGVAAFVVAMFFKNGSSTVGLVVAVGLLFIAIGAVL